MSDKKNHSLYYTIVVVYSLYLSSMIEWIFQNKFQTIDRDLKLYKENNNSEKYILQNINWLLLLLLMTNVPHFIIYRSN